MFDSSIRSGRVAIGLLLCFGLVAPASAAIQQVTGYTEVSVTRLINGSANGTESENHSSPPSTQPTVSSGKIDALGTLNAVLGTAAATSVFTDSRTQFGFIPNDAGIDVAAFTVDPTVSFTGHGLSRSTRRILLTGADLNFPTSQPAEVRSTVFVAGALLLAADTPSRDLSGLYAEVLVRVNQVGPHGALVLSGRARLEGQSDGSIVLVREGAFQQTSLGVVDLLAVAPQLDVPGLGLVRVVPFAVVPLDYLYRVTSDQVFDLEATFEVNVQTAPGNSAAAGIFGLPQINLGDSMARVRQDDAGTQIQDEVSELVDTTGRSGPPAAGFPLFGLCGVLGFESAALFAGMGLLMCVRARGAANPRGCGDMADVKSDALWATLRLVGATLLLGTAWLVFRRWWRGWSRDDSAAATLTLQDLRDMHQRGQITEAELNSLRQATLARTREIGVAGGAAERKKRGAN